MAMRNKKQSKTNKQSPLKNMKHELLQFMKRHDIHEIDFGKHKLTANKKSQKK